MQVHAAVASGATLLLAIIVGHIRAAEMIQRPHSAKLGLFKIERDST